MNPPPPASLIVLPTAPRWRATAQSSSMSELDIGLVSDEWLVMNRCHDLVAIINAFPEKSRALSGNRVGSLAVPVATAALPGPWLPG